MLTNRLKVGSAHRSRRRVLFFKDIVLDVYEGTQFFLCLVLQEAFFDYLATGLNGLQRFRSFKVL
jgi:hypothetical protein